MNTSPIQNPDLLLSCAMDQNQSDFPLIDHSYSILNSPTNFNCMIDSEFLNSTTTTATTNVPRFEFEQQLEQDSLSLDSNKDIKEEILDFNIFELLQHEEPEMAKLIDPVNYLPQISVNTATRILDNVSTPSATLKPSNSSNSLSSSSLSSVLMELHKSSQSVELLENTHTELSKAKPSLFRLEDLDQSQMSASFKELCDLLSIKKSPDSDEKSKYLTPPLTPTDASPTTKTRTSMRLVYKKQRSLKNEVKQEPESLTPKTNKRAKRKRPSFHLDSDDSSADESEENAIKSEAKLTEDYSNDQIYNDEDDNDNDDDDDDSIDSNSENSSNGGYPCSTKSGGRIIQNKRETKGAAAVEKSRRDSLSLDPIKKESNKEAATRYRLKKISEKDKLFETRSGLEKENDFVKRKIELVQTEINYLKNILVQMILTKSLINNGNN